ncbi:unnamed protein product [Albugo candida]|uniref:Uncharacterized protein n=1 Tax=Albugo candida TaxID=65357 RepID=A0A024GBR5_9STRA|nr:unnamed protein product [Albugo candida]|eukprot:CCI44109.1 unnamed protein product [Albugo candida]
MSHARKESACRDFVQYIYCDRKFEWSKTSFFICVKSIINICIPAVGKISIRFFGVLTLMLAFFMYGDVCVLFPPSFLIKFYWKALVFDERQEYTSALETIDFRIVFRTTYTNLLHILKNRSIHRKKIRRLYQQANINNQYSAQVLSSLPSISSYSPGRSRSGNQIPTWRRITAIIVSISTVIHAAKVGFYIIPKR